MDAVQRINILFPKYLDRQITEIEWEKEKLLVWLSALNEEELTVLSYSQKYLWEKAKAGELPSATDKVNWDKILSTILSTNDDTLAIPVHRVHFLKTSWFRYAAAVIIIAGATVVAVLNSHQNDIATTNGNKHLQMDIAPGTNKAILTTGTGVKIDLASNKTGIAVNNAVTYNDGEKIANPPGTLLKGMLARCLQLTTPRGRSMTSYGGAT